MTFFDAEDQSADSVSRLFTDVSGGYLDPTGNLGTMGLVTGFGFVLDESIFEDGFESGDTSAWSSAVP